MSRRIVTDTEEHLIMKKRSFCQEDKRTLYLKCIIPQSQNRAKMDRITRRNKQIHFYSGSFFFTHTHCILFLQEINRLTPSIVNE